MMITMVRTVRMVSRLLYGCTMMLAGGYMLTSLYVFAVVVLQTPELRVIDDGRRFAVMFPWTQVVFLRGEYSMGQIGSMVLLLGCYGVFFYLLSAIFHTFRQQRWFTEQGLQSLRWFYWANLLAPSVVYVAHRLWWQVEEPAEILVVIHAVVGVLAFFLAAIVQQGLHLQNEQDLII